MKLRIATPKGSAEKAAEAIGTRVVCARGSFPGVFWAVTNRRDSAAVGAAAPAARGAGGADREREREEASERLQLPEEPVHQALLRVLRERRALRPGLQLRGLPQQQLT